jgi:hypothetical protein
MGASAGREAARGCTHRRGKRLPQPSSRPWLLGTERRLTLTDARSARPTRLNPSPAWRQTQAQGRNVGHRATTPPEADKFVSRHNNASRSMRSAGGPFAARAATKAGGFDAGAGGSGHRPCCRRASQMPNLLRTGSRDAQLARSRCAASRGQDPLSSSRGHCANDVLAGCARHRQSASRACGRCFSGETATRGRRVDCWFRPVQAPGRGRLRPPPWPECLQERCKRSVLGSGDMQVQADI